MGHHQVGLTIPEKLKTAIVNGNVDDFSTFYEAYYEESPEIVKEVPLFIVSFSFFLRSYIYIYIFLGSLWKTKSRF